MAQYIKLGIMSQGSCLYYLKTFDLSFPSCIPIRISMHILLDYRNKESTVQMVGVALLNRASVCLGEATGFMRKGQHDPVFTNK